MVHGLVDRLGRLPGIRRQRVWIWAAVVLSIVVVLGVQAMMPGWRVLPGFSGQLTAGMMLALFMMALGCEFVDSSLGMGYGTTLTPVLLLMGFEPLQIVPCVLASEFITGLFAGLMHHRDGNVDLLRDRQVRRTILLLSVLSVFGTIAAVTLALKIPKFWLTAIISIIVLSVGVVVLATFRKRPRFRSGHIVALGTVAAFNKGLSGGGYGPLVTAGQVVSGLSPKQAVAITSLAESLTCAVGLMTYFLLNKEADWALALPLTSGAVLSVPIATLAVRRLPERAMRLSVGVTTCGLGAFSLCKLLM